MSGPWIPGVAAEIAFVRTGDAQCFGCGHENADGFQLDFRQVGARAVEAVVVVHQRFTGPPGVVHGGIQATLLDEVMGKAAYTGFADTFETLRFLTAELNVRYRRPAPTGVELTVRGEIDHLDDRYVHLRGALLDSQGNELTTATSRWRYLPNDSPG